MLKNKIYFLALGGSDEIGMNLNLYCYNDRWLMVDIGVSFSQNEVSDISMAGLEGWLETYPDAVSKLDGILITHAHEDHYGALVHLWHKLHSNKTLKVYTTPFTADLLQHKIKDKFGLDTSIKIPIEIRNINEDYNIGQYKISTIYMTHSTVEQMACVIEFPNGQRILHTGDWKIDAFPVIGNLTNIEKLEQLMNKGNVVAIVGDSTNALEENNAGSEASVADDLLEYIKTLSQRIVIVTQFASNLARMQSCINIAHATGRLLLICGRSMQRFYLTGIAHGYIKPNDNVHLVGYFDESGKPIHSGHINKKQRLFVLSTGSQGEENAFLARLANGRINRHFNLELSENTIVIFSSREIPGNEKAIFKLINNLIKKGVRVITRKTRPAIHVSGHPGKADLKYLYTLVKPSCIIPVHGEPIHIQAHKEFAEELGFKSCFTHNGALMCVEHTGVILTANIRTSKYYLYGNDLIPYDNKIFSQRKMLSIGGLLVINIRFHNTHNSVPEIKISQRAIFPENSSVYKTFIREARGKLLEMIKNNHIGYKFVKDAMCNILSQFFPNADTDVILHINE